MKVIKGLENFIPNIDKKTFVLMKEMEENNIIGASRAIISSFVKAKKAASSNANILIEGESGTGKELFAVAIHKMSKRSNGPIVKLNCAEIPETLLESELFGYERGAFTGANKRKLGKFELANRGTIFLDEISELSLPLQAKLLRVIEDKSITRVGGLENIEIDVRIISATNRNLWEYVKTHNFREDLFYRLNVISLRIPPLKERKEDIPILIDHFIKKYNEIENTAINFINPEVVRLLISFNWTGNIRQLENVIHQAVIMSNDNKISTDDIPEHILLNLPQIESNNNMFQKQDVIITDYDLQQMEIKQIIKALEKTRWNKSEAAKLLGIHRNTLQAKIKRFRLE